MESIQGQYDRDWVDINQESARRKSVASEVSVKWAGGEFTSFEEISFAAMHNRPLKRGKKRASETGDANCGDKKRFCSLGVDYILRTAPSMEGLLDAISDDFSNVKEVVKQMTLEKFIAAMTNEQTQGMLELVLKLRASIEQETLGCCSKMKEAIMYNQQTNENEFNNRLEKLELWSKVGCDLAEVLQKQIAENKQISAQAINSVQAKAEEMYNKFSQWHGGEIKK